MFILKMAAKNLFRYRKRTIITGLAIAVGLIFYLFMDSLLRGWYGNTERQYIDYEVASGRIVTSQWWEEKENLPLNQSIEDPGKIITLLEELDISYTPRTEFQADLIFYKDPFPEDGTYPAKITAVDPETDGRVFKLTGAMDHEASRGEFLSREDDGIVVGNGLAAKLGMEPGYPVRLQFSGKGGYQEVLNTRVRGIIKTENHLVNLSGVFIAMDAADYYLDMGGTVTGLSILVPSGREGRRKLESLESGLPEGYILLGYEEIASEFMAMQDMENGFVGLFLFLIFLIAAVGISNTMMTAIFERRREIGMMRAQGVHDGKIRLLFFLEAGGIGMVGTAAGILGGILVNIPLVNTGLNYGAMLGTEADFIDFGGIVIDSYMKGVWSPESFIIGGVLAVLVSSLAAWFPVNRMLKKEIPDNLRAD